MLQTGVINKEEVEYEVNEGLGETAVKAGVKVAKTVGKKLGKAKYNIGQGLN